MDCIIISSDEDTPITTNKVIKTKKSSHVHSAKKESKKKKKDVNPETKEKTDNCANGDDCMNKFLFNCRKTIGKDDKGQDIVLGLHKKYLECKNEYLKSISFSKFLMQIEESISKEPDEFYVHLTRVFDEIVKSSRRELLSKEEDEKKLDSKIKKLERFLEKLGKKIKYLELKDMNLENEDDSAYVLESKFKNKYLQVWKKICSLKKQSTRVGKAIEKKFKFKEFPYPEMQALCTNIENFVNKNKLFPDFQDILTLVKDFEKVSTSVNMSEYVMYERAQKLFLIIGKTLKLRRQRDLKETLTDYATLEGEEPKDLADEDSDLKRKLLENKEIGEKKIEMLIDSYVHKQIELKSKILEKNGQVLDDDKKDSIETDEEESEEDDDDDEEEEEDNSLDKEDDEDLNCDQDKQSDSNIEPSESEDSDSEEIESELITKIKSSIFEAPIEKNSDGELIQIQPSTSNASVKRPRESSNEPEESYKKIKEDI